MYDQPIFATKECLYSIMWPSIEMGWLKLFMSSDEYIAGIESLMVLEANKSCYYNNPLAVSLY